MTETPNSGLYIDPGDCEYCNAFPAMPCALHRPLGGHASPLPGGVAPTGEKVPAEVLKQKQEALRQAGLSGYSRDHVQQLKSQVPYLASRAKTPEPEPFIYDPKAED